MKIINTFKKVFTKDRISSSIDYFYGGVFAYMEYVGLFIGLLGGICLINVYPNILVIGIWEGIPQAVKVEIQQGFYTGIVTSLFLIWEGIKITKLFWAGMIESLFEVLITTIVVFIQINFNPIITSDRVAAAICSFMVLKVGLIAITKLFKISTRHFGSYIVSENHPIGNSDFKG